MLGQQILYILGMRAKKWGEYAAPKLSMHRPFKKSLLDIFSTSCD